MFIACLTIFSSILSSLQEVSYMKVHVYCVFDYFPFNFDSTSVGELRECACLLCVWLFLFNLIPTLDCELRKNVSLLWVWLFSFQSCLHFSGELRVKVHVYCVFDYFLFNLVSTSGCELRESACLLCLTIFSSILSPLQFVSYVKVHVYYTSILSPL